MNTPTQRVRISFAAHLKPVPVAGFIISEINSVSSMSKAIGRYRKPVLVKGAAGWYIKYYYRIPLEVRKLYEDKEWMRFRVKEDINRRKGADREEYAAWLLEQITLSLKNGYNPFNPDQEKLAAIEDGIQKNNDVLSIRAALELFLEKWETRGLDPKSYNKYKRYVGRFLDWLITKHIPEIDATRITTDHMEKFLTENKLKHKLSNREYNNTLLFLRTAFNYLVKKKIIPESPLADVDKQEARTVKHRYFDAASLKVITTGLQVNDPYTYLAFQTIYYLCIRAEKELMHFKIGNIQWDQDKVFIDTGKANTQRYIPMDENIKAIFLEHKFNEYPANYFVFGPWGKPSPTPFGGTFFSRKFGKVRKFLKMDEQFSLYGAKHTRVVHLKQDGAKDSDIMSLTGHKDFTAYAKYMRDLGLEADVKKINNISRKV